MHAVVIGGSLAGSSAALALARTGWRVTVLERSSSVPTGLGIGIDRELLGSVTGADAASLAVIETGFPATGWSSVLELLWRTAERDPGIVLHTGLAASGIDLRGHGAVVHTEGGDIPADLVVGADGYRSLTRQFVDPARPRAAYSGFVLWRGMVAEGDLPTPFRDSELDFRIEYRSEGVLATYGVPAAAPPTTGGTRAAPSPAGGRRGVYTWFDAGRGDLLRRVGALERGAVVRTVRAADIDERTLTGLRREASAWPAPWAGVIDADLRHRSFIGTPVAEYRPSRMSRGPVVLIGDAAHVVSPVTGLGFHTCLLDIDALTDAVRDIRPPEVASAARRYEARRLGPARRLVEESQAWSARFVASSGHRPAG